MRVSADNFIADTLAASASVTLAFERPISSGSIIVSDSANLTVAQITNDPNTLDEAALWSDIDFTNNAAGFAGIITGIKLTANGSGCSYSIRGTSAPSIVPAE